MAKKFNPEEISSTLDVESFELPASGACRSGTQIPDGETTETITATRELHDDREKTVNYEKLASSAKRVRKLPDWMIKAGQEKSKSSSLESSEKKNRRKKTDTAGSTKQSYQTKPDDIYIMSDEDILDVARYFIKNK